MGKYLSLMPNLNGMTDASYTARFEDDCEQAIDLCRRTRNNARLMVFHSVGDSSVGMTTLTQGNED